MRGSLRSMDEIAMCEESSDTEAVSPNTEYVATTFVRNCGATTKYVSHVNLRKTSDSYPKDQYGVIRVGEVFSVGGKPRTEVLWVSDTELKIKVPDSDASQAY